MEKEIVSGELGTVGSYKLNFAAGKLHLVVNAAFSPVVAGLNITVDANEVIDAIAAAIPGKLDDMALALVKAALAVA